MGKRWFVAGIAALVVAAAFAVGIVISTRDSAETFCQGIGLIGPSASTPEGALGAVLRQQHGRLADWKRADRRTVERGNSTVAYQAIDFVPRHTPVRPAYSRVVVDNSRASWRASGACVAATEDESDPTPPARYRDTYGRLEIVLTAEDLMVPRPKGNGERFARTVDARIGGKDVSVPAGTPLYGTGCAGLWDAGKGGWPCFAQAGLRDDGTTVRWLLVFNRAYDLEPIDARHDARAYRPPTWSGTVRAVRGRDIVFMDGSVIPAADGLRDPTLCPAATDLTIDMATGRAVKVRCQDPGPFPEM